jgi:glycosyltransferase involved in cell wall biosynthesis
MKILYLCPDTGIDVLGHKGASVHVREMCAAFVRAGHQVDLVAPRIVKPGEEAATTAADVRRVRVPDDVQEVSRRLREWAAPFVDATSLPKDVRRILYDQALVAELDATYGGSPPDLIYVRASLLSTAGVALAERTGRPLVVEVNAPLSVEQERYRAGALGELYRSVEQRLLTAATAVSVVSDALREHVVGLGVDPVRVAVLPNGIDPHRFVPHQVPAAERARLGIPDGPVLGFVGGLRPWHGVEALPRVLAQVQQSHPDASLVIAGDGPLRADIARVAAETGTTDRVVLLGAVDHDDMPSVIASFDVALAPYPVLPHDFWYSPLKVFEYLGCGVPVVASAVGQIAELVADGEHAVLVPPGDVAALATASAALLDDPARARAIGAAGARLVHARWTWDGNAAWALGVTAVAP